MTFMELIAQKPRNLVELIAMLECADEIIEEKRIWRQNIYERRLVLASEVDEDFREAFLQRIEDDDDMLIGQCPRFWWHCLLDGYVDAASHANANNWCRWRWCDMGFRANQLGQDL